MGTPKPKNRAILIQILIFSTLQVTRANFFHFALVAAPVCCTSDGSVRWVAAIRQTPSFRMKVTVDNIGVSYFPSLSAPRSPSRQRATAESEYTRARKLSIV